MDFLDDKALERGIVEEQNNPSITPLPVSMSQEVVDDLILKLQNPVVLQTELAAKLKLMIDARVKRELDETGVLTDGARKWVDTYNNVLNNIQQNLYGTKSLNLNLNTKVSHKQVSMLINKYGQKNDDEEQVHDVDAQPEA